MLDNSTIKKIEDFVYQMPRSVQEVAEHMGKNWRTADRYLKEIEKNFGTIATRVFRGGTRGALKIVYGASVEKISFSVFQQRLEQEILRAKRKEDFSAFDIFQHVPQKKKKAHLEKEKTEEKIGFKNIAEILSQAQKQVLIFSGNLSFIHFQSKNKKLLEVIEEAIKRNITIKVLCRVDIVSKKNIQDLLALNFKHGKELIEIHHREQPLRATIIDNHLLHLKEIKEPTGKIHELDKKFFIFYTIKDKEWIEWLTRIFWKMFSCSIDARTRLHELENLT